MFMSRDFQASQNSNIPYQKLGESIFHLLSPTIEIAIVSYLVQYPNKIVVQLQLAKMDPVYAFNYTEIIAVRSVGKSKLCALHYAKTKLFCTKPFSL